MQSLGHGPAFHDDGTVTFRLWAPLAQGVTLVLCDGGEPRELAMEAAHLGWFHLTVRAGAGDDYAYRLEGGPVRPDPASRRQPDGVHGWSRLVDAAGFVWSAATEAFRAAPLSEAVVYELHVGTFTSDGTLAAAADHLVELAALGVTHVELMPVNAFSGVHGWGYDGVAWWAVHEPYGGPDGLVAFVDACHRTGLAVVLDSVYNHLGPSGNYLPEFGPYLTDRHETPWGRAVNLDGPGSDEVRSFILGSAVAWLRDYRVDALRLDAVQGLVDTSATHILAQLSAAVADLARQQGRPLQLIAESDRNDPATVQAVAEHGLGMDAQWADDLHHGLHTALTGESSGWYVDYRGLHEAAAAYRRGFVFDGTRYSIHRGRRVGAALPIEVPGWRLVGCLQNHDQVGNRAGGERLTTIADPAAHRAAVVLLLGAPHVPMLFMGEEYGETNPFQYFTSHPEPGLGRAVSEGRWREFAQFFEAFAGDIPDPQDPATRDRSVLDRSRRQTEAGRAWLALWTELVRIRRQEPALREGPRALVELHHVSEHAVAIVRGHPTCRPVLVVANLGALTVEMVVPGRNGGWTLLVGSADPRYGGAGETVSVAGRGGTPQTVTVPARTAALLAARPPSRGERAGGTGRQY
jgi:maltooligosyltrehalose trehalohydrolase